jgi:hypothetical protein
MTRLLSFDDVEAQQNQGRSAPVNRISHPAGPLAAAWHSVAVDLTIRPRRNRHVKPAVALAVVLALFALCGGAKVVDRLSLGHLTIQPVTLAVLVAMGLVPAVALGTLTALNIRNMALRTDGHGLVLTEWTGRVVALQRPVSARLYPISSTYGNVGQLLVVADPPGGEAVVLAPTWWTGGELESLLDRLRLRVHTEAPVLIGEIRRRYPAARLPLSVRHPWLFSGGMVAFTIGYLGVMVYLDLRF